VTKVDHEDCQPTVIDRIDHPVVAHSEPVRALKALQSEHARRPGLLAEPVDGGLHPTPNWLVKYGAATG